MHKITRPLSHEVMWYTVALPALVDDDVSDMCPKCYYGNVEEVSDEAVECGNVLSLASKIVWRKAERGLLMLEDIGRDRQRRGDVNVRSTMHFRVPLHPTYPPSNARAVTVYRKCNVTFLIF